jgi:hypothetical protein
MYNVVPVNAKNPVHCNGRTGGALCYTTWAESHGVNSPTLAGFTLLNGELESEALWPSYSRISTGGE